MMSRLMLNLHESAGIHTAVTNISSSDNSTTLLFTSRIAMHEGDILTGPVTSDLSIPDTRYMEEMTSADNTLDQEEAIEMVPRGRSRKSIARSDSDC